VNTTKTVHLCDCGEHGVSVTRWQPDDDPKSTLVLVGVWRLGHHGVCTCWRCKLRLMLYVLRTGKAFDDELVLTREGAHLLAAAINEAADSTP
jgi:hypothetical protein